MGIVKGRQDGEQIGLTKGARRMLQNILIARFKLKALPDWAVKVLNEASLSQIEAWGVKETDGKTLKEFLKS